MDESHAPDESREDSYAVFNAPASRPILMDESHAAELYAMLSEIQTELRKIEPALVELYALLNRLAVLGEFADAVRNGEGIGAAMGMLGRKPGFRKQDYP